MDEIKAIIVDKLIEAGTLPLFDKKNEVETLAHEIYMEIQFRYDITPKKRNTLRSLYEEFAE